MKILDALGGNKEVLLDVGIVLLSCTCLNNFFIYTIVVIARCPGWVNLMGRHIDHQGGYCNLTTIDYETLAVVHPRDDDSIFLNNLDREKFSNLYFSIGDLLV